MRSAIGGLVRRTPRGSGRTHLEAGDAALTERHAIYILDSTYSKEEEEEGERKRARRTATAGFISPTGRERARLAVQISVKFGDDYIYSVGI